MINERPFESNPYLKLRGESQLLAKHRFEWQAGWRFGLVFGVLVVFMAYGWDAVQLAFIHADFWWVKFLLGCVTILPLAFLAGGIAGHLNWILKLVVWSAFGVIGGYCALHIPFQGARLLLQNVDSSLRLVEYLPIPAAATDSFGMLATLGICLGILVGLAHTALVGWAWERSTEDYRMTLGGWGILFLSFPLAFAFAFLFDGTAHAPLRSPMQLIYNTVESGLNDAPNQDVSAMELHRALTYSLGQRWNKNFTHDYTVRLVSSEPSQVGESFVDTAFSNGFLWRCRVTTYGEFTGTCYDLKAEYTRYISEFVPRGSFRCTDCQSEITPQAAEWRAQNARPLGDTDRIAIAHGAGSSVIVRVQSQNAKSFECLVWGANPVIIQECHNL